MDYLLMQETLKQKAVYLSNSAAAYWNVFRNVLATTYREKRLRKI
jgi:hypothetical protein